VCHWSEHGSAGQSKRGMNKEDAMGDRSQKDKNKHQKQKTHKIEIDAKRKQEQMQKNVL
jgi:hypothetical protein